MLRRLAVRVRALVGRWAAEAELDEELRYHLDREIERNVAAGVPPAEARLLSARAFGNVTYLKEEVRDSWGVGWFDALRQDIRFALRGFRRSPAFVATVVLTIALALGLNTSAFTIFDAYVLRPLAVRDAGSLYEVSVRDHRGRGARLSWQRYQVLRALPITAEGFAYAFVSARFNEHPMFGSVVSGDALRVLGATPELGRLLLDEDAAPPSGEPVMVLSYRAWQSTFGADSSIIGQTVVVHGLPVTVVGVTAKRFTGIGAVPPDFWAPLTLLSRLAGTDDPFGSRESAVLRAVLRLKPGVTERRAQAALAVWAAGATINLPDTLRWTRADLVSVATALPLTAETISIFAPAAVAFGLVLLIACANIANVMLARGIARQREIGIRLALGAAQSRLVRQLLTESTALAIAAAALGFVISRLTIDIGVRVMFASAPAAFVPHMRVAPLAPDLRVFGFLFVVSLASALAFGLFPALQATRLNLVQASRGDFDAGLRLGHLRGALVVAQIGVCSLLLIVTGILLRGARSTQRQEVGMRTHDVVALRLDARAPASVLRRLRSEPMVCDVGVSTQSPLDGVYPSLGVRAEDDRRIEMAAYDFVDAGYFRVLGIPLLRGRLFTADEERDGAPVAIISEAAARHLWPGRDPVGQVLQLGADPPQRSRLASLRTARVIGVSRNAVSGWMGTGLERPVIYYPTGAESAGITIIARVTGDGSQARERLDHDIAAIDPGAVDDIHTLDDFLAIQRWPFRLLSWVSSAIGAIALALTIIGIYGVLSHLVAQRTREIGIRLALGATVSLVVGQVLRQSLRYAAIGIASGAVLALAVSRLLRSFIEVVDTFDAAGYAFGVLVVFTASAVAAWAPAQRAARVNPCSALRQD